MRKLAVVAGVLTCVCGGLVGGAARAGTITVSATAHIAPTGSVIGRYALYSGAQPLNGVTIAISGTSTSPAFVFRNLTSAAVTYTGQIDQLTPGMNTKGVFTETLGAFASATHSSTENFASFGVETSFLSTFIGTGTHAADITLAPAAASASSADIAVSRLGPLGSIDATETVTYYFGADLPPGVTVPEPASWVLMGLGLVAACAWRLRAA